MPTWPTSLPQHVLEQGYTERMQDNRIESAMDSGPAKARRRFTTQLRSFSVTVQMTPEQADIFEVFYETTLLSGSVSFDWVHPRTRTSVTLRFKKPAPVITVAGAGEIVRASFVLETLP